MDSKENEMEEILEWNCPIYDKVIDEVLCWKVVNVGKDVLKLPDNEMPPCSWNEARKICKGCPHFSEWD